jgi:hypothetical protein
METQDVGSFGRCVCQPDKHANYRDKCKEMGADADQLASVDRMIERLRDWRANNLHRLKVPDAKGEKLLG